MAAPLQLCLAEAVNVFKTVAATRGSGRAGGVASGYDRGRRCASLLSKPTEAVRFHEFRSQSEQDTDWDPTPITGAQAARGVHTA